MPVKSILATGYGNHVFYIHVEGRDSDRHTESTKKHFIITIFAVRGWPSLCTMPVRVAFMAASSPLVKRQARKEAEKSQFD